MTHLLEDEKGTDMEGLNERYRHNHIFKMEQLIGHMNSPKEGLPFETSGGRRDPFSCCFSGSDLVKLIHKRLNTTDTQEAIHVATFFLRYGYIYPVSELDATRVKADPSMKYRMQAPCYWPSKFSRPDEVDYGIYLCKLKFKHKDSLIEKYEEQAFDAMKDTMRDKWEAICLQAKGQIRVERMRLKEDRVILFLQERAYWRRHRPPPNATNYFTDEAPRNWTLSQICARQKDGNKPEPSQNLDFAAEELARGIQNGQKSDQNHRPSDANERSTIALRTEDHQLENLINYGIANLTSDGLIEQLEYENPWHKKNQTEGDWPVECTGCSESGKSFPQSLPCLKQARLWAVGLDNLLADPLGQHWLEWFMQKEHSCENMRFWSAVNQYRFGPLSRMETECKRIFCEYISDNGSSEVNVDDSLKEAIMENIMENPTIFIFDSAQQHIYNMVKRDTYMRFIRSADYAHAVHHAQYHAETRVSHPDH
ncbi:hypothetical protein D915_002443 [Fasciola hepatica]|uniref:RGS domain-containing protein n=1 Tax=Fasciola hepatica TaxID=6192 RepID=A0A4E0RGT5_FASHE|nr:hypothetical protein D915_002443 [Fasciola hepatica]